MTHRVHLAGHRPATARSTTKVPQGLHKRCVLPTGDAHSDIPSHAALVVLPRCDKKIYVMRQY